MTTSVSHEHKLHINEILCDNIVSKCESILNIFKRFALVLQNSLILLKKIGLNMKIFIIVTR